MKQTSWAKSYLGVIAVAFLLAVIIRFFVVEAYRIPTNAMHPTLEPGDVIFVQKWPFGLRDPFSTADIWTTPGKPQIGDVVVFAVPGLRNREAIRRVLALEGDNVGVEGGIVTRNGKIFLISGTQKDNCAQEKWGEKIWMVCMEPPVLPKEEGLKVPSSHVFLAADNRSQPKTIDTYTYGFVPENYLRSRAAIIWLSLDPGSKGGFSAIRFDRILKKL